MNKTLAVICFDINDDELLENRQYDMLIVEHEEGQLKQKLYKYFEQMHYCWDDYNKIRQG